MRSLLSLTAAAGLSEWVLCSSQGLLDDCAGAFQQVAGLRSWQLPTPRLASSFALGRVRVTEYPVVLLARAEEAADFAPLLGELRALRRSVLLLLIGEPALDGLPVEIQRVAELDESALCRAVELAEPVVAAMSEAELEAFMAEGVPKKLRVASRQPEPRFRGSLVALSTLLRFRYHEGVILAIGQLDPSEIPSVLWFAETLRVPAVIDASSGLREVLDHLRLSRPSLLLEQSLPYHVIRLGDFSFETAEQQEIWAQVFAHGGGELFEISRTGRSPFAERSQLVVGELEQVMKALGDVQQVGDVLDILPSSRQREARLEELVHCEPEGAEAMMYNLSLYVTLAQSVTLGDAESAARWNEHAQHQFPMDRVAMATQREGFSPLAEYLALSLDDAYSFYFATQAEDAAEILGLLAQLPKAHRVLCLREPYDLEGVTCQSVHQVDDFDALNDFSEGEPASLILYLAGSR